MRILLAVAVFGALGASARYGVGLWMTRLTGTGSVFGVPAGTLVVNVLGSLILGLLTALTLRSDALSPTWRFALGTGFLGSFTTFSTFSVETVRMLEQGDGRGALANLALQLGVGLAAAVAGLALGRSLGG